jgi:hypothetical protein
VSEREREKQATLNAQRPSQPAERRKNNTQLKKCERSYHTTLLDLKVLHECFIFQQKGSEREQQPPRAFELSLSLSLFVSFLLGFSGEIIGVDSRQKDQTGLAALDDAF